MKLTAVLLLTAVLQVSAKTYSQTITLNLQNAPLDKVVKEIQRQSKFNFFYEEGLFRDAKPVTLSVSKLTLQQTLELCFSGQPFEYKIVQSTVFVKRKEFINVRQAETVSVNNGDFKGRVLTKDGEPLVSANVVNKRTGKGTSTDANGNFLLHDVSLNDILVISYTGYAQRSIKVSEFLLVTLVMEPAVNELDQVVMQAYGTTTQRFNTGNIARVTSDEISKQPVINPLQALQGRIPGLIVSQTNGFASAPYKVELRGRNSIDPKIVIDPLYIIDGVPLTIMDISSNRASNVNGTSGFLQNGLFGPANGQSPLFSLNPSDIESIEVLKDADATAIYGSRAANGVILITTKKGKAGKAKLDINFQQGISRITRFWDMLNTEQYLEMRREAFKNSGQTITTGNAPDLLVWDSTHYIDWQKYIWGGTGKNTAIQVGLTGGNATTSFRLSAGYSRVTNILVVSGADQRGSIAFNLNQRSSNQKLNIGFTTGYSFSESNMISLPGTAVILPPNAPDVFDEFGKLNYNGWNPARSQFRFAGLLQPYNAKTHFLNSNLTITYEVIKSLIFRTSFGFNTAQAIQESFTPIASQDPNTNPTGSAAFGNNINRNWIIEPQLEYSRYLGQSKFNVLIGGTAQGTTSRGQLISGTGYTNDALLRTISNAPTQAASENVGSYRYSAVFARIGYNFKNKYLLNISGRRDGSSNFGEGRQFGNFGALGVAWIFSEESWLKNNLKFLSYGKIRASYGTTGSEGPAYGYLSRWSARNPAYNGIVPLAPDQHANPDYRWQENRKLEAGIDLNFFNDRIGISTAYYRNRCDNQLVAFPVPSYTGFSSVVSNSPAYVENSGYEIGLRAKIWEGKSIQWDINFNVAINKNKLLDYPYFEKSPYYGKLIIGKSLNIRRVLHYTGVDGQTGQYTFEDTYGDGVINTSSVDTTSDLIPFDLNPKFLGGFGTNFSYKNWQLGLFFNFMKQIGQNAFFGLQAGTLNNMPTAVLSRWQKNGDISEFARYTTLPGTDDSRFRSQSDGIFTDASFIRLQNVSLSYNLPLGLLSKAGIKKGGLFIHAQNLFVITKYKGVDPETQNFGGMPPSKVIAFGISLNF
ncbi:SusC/RagA family TonB-linked outer membrane protein [Niastella sp. OAS944]|uniref:SusC/RagA family TonB-linked outer membrane protein n=1 Tax=Niastella sp. OAS944 TaxID=2664089 RepID=UPI0035C7E4C2|nr:TonB-linked SusC/RagA family outer membrane protein [Chitinophagaceae bacterium OAS944]